MLYEDRDILIVDKPAGLLTQPTPDRERDTLLERAGRYLSQTRRLASPYVGIVHRIDKLTTGVVLLVCSPRALRPFQSLFAHAIERSYLAVVDGVVLPGKGTIDLGSCLTAETAAEGSPRRSTRCARGHPLRVDRAIRDQGESSNLPARDRTHASDPHSSGCDRASGRG